MDIPAIQPIPECQISLLVEDGALSRLEEVACWFASRQGKGAPEPLKAAIVLFAADHGVAAPSRETTEQVRQVAAGQGVINRLLAQGEATLKIVDVGVAGDLSDLPGIEQAKVRSGSGNIAVTAAMSPAEYWEAVGIGEEMANQTIDAGANLLIAGNLGSGHHVAASAILCELLGLAAEDALDLPEGGDPERYSHDLLAVERALARAQGTPSHDILMQLGGLEIAAMAGFYRAAAQRGVPILLDGFISAVAALAAVAWHVHIAGWMLASHVSKQLGHRQVLDELGLDPLVHLQQGLQAGEGAALLLPVLQSALKLHAGLLVIEEHEGN